MTGNAELITEARAVCADFADDYFDSTRAALALARLANALEAAEADLGADMDWGTAIRDPDGSLWGISPEPFGKDAAIAARGTDENGQMVVTLTRRSAGGWVEAEA